jgi:hypothetical protein
MRPNKINCLDAKEKPRMQSRGTSLGINWQVCIDEIVKFIKKG